MRRILSLNAIGALSLLVAGACSSSPDAASATSTTSTEGSSSTGSPPRRVVAHADLGDGTAADLYDDGSLDVTKQGDPFVSGSAFGVFSDAITTDAFHDPQTPRAWKKVDVSTVAMDSPAPGVLHLTLARQGPTDALVSFALDADDGAVMGLGERFDHVDAKGLVVPMFLTLSGAIDSGTNETHVPIPFFVDSRGYGVFVASRQAGAFDVASSRPGEVRAAFEPQDNGPVLEVFLYAPKSADPIDVVRAYTRQTGAPKVPPTWSLAPMHWRNEWADAATLLGDLDEYRTRHIPASTVWIDNPWQTSYNDATLDPARFGDAAALMQGIADRGFKAIAWSTPYLERPLGAPPNPAQTLWSEADKSGFFVKQDGKSWTAFGCCVDGAQGMIDFTNPDASTFWAGVLGAATSAGFVGFKLDYGEDLVTSALGVRLQVQRADGETERTARSYPLGYHAAYRAALDAAGADGFLIGRASSYGGQAVVDAIWPGDLDDGFQRRAGSDVGGLPAAIVGAQTIGASGFPSFGSDTGGYRGGAPTREVLLRWAEHTAYSVVMQLGGGGDSHDPWSYDEQAADLYKALAIEHMQLVPYLSNLLADARANGTPPIRSLPLAFPGDRDGFAFADDEYMLGDDILVAPVVDAGKTSRIVHVPPGDWVHMHLALTTSGPSKTEIAVPIGAGNALVRAGAVLPLYPADLETLVDAASGAVSLATIGGRREARVFAAAKGSAKWPEGATLAYAADAQSLAVTFGANAAVNDVFITLSTRASAFAPAPQGALVAVCDGATAAELGDEAAVRASSAAPGFAVSPDGSTMWIRLPRGAASCAFTKP